MAIIVMASIVVAGVLFIQKGLQIRAIDHQLSLTGLTVPAHVVGFKYGAGGKTSSGDYPLVSYVTASGQAYTYLAWEHGVVRIQDRGEVAAKKIEVIYLPTSPTNAHVTAWYSSSGAGFIQMGVIIILVATMGLLAISGVLPKSWMEAAKS